ncbi:MAG TPA: hypothetical protein VIV56_16825 [Gemmatimonadales bacterium]
MSQHTPGEWRVQPMRPDIVRRYRISCVVGDRPERVLARCSGDDCEANARLIAAAPELLDALRFLVHYIELRPRLEPMVHEPLMAKARAALAAAVRFEHGGQNL